MSLIQIPLPTGTFSLPQGDAANSLLVNMMPQIPSHESAQKFILVPTPGWATQFTGGSGPVRGMVLLANQETVWISAGTVYNSGAGAVGSVDTAGSATMATDGTNVISVMNGRAFQTTGGTTTEITSGMPFTPQSICYNSGYFVVVAGGSRVWFISGLDAITWDPLDFASCEGGSTNIQICKSIHLDVWFFCESTVEVWYLSGAADFPFQRQLGGFLEVGIDGPLSVAKADNTLVWVGNDRKVYKADGYSPLKISDASLDYWLSTAQLGDAIGMELVLNGQNCWGCKFPTSARTWIYSFATETWFNMSSTTIANSWRGQFSMIANGLLLVGDGASGAVAAAQPIFTEYGGNAIPREVQFQNIYARTKRTFMGRLMLDVHGTVGADTVLLQWADEGGAFNAGRTLTMTGASPVRIFATRLGSFLRRLFAITGTPTGDFSILDCWAEVTPSIEASSGDGS